MEQCAQSDNIYEQCLELKFKKDNNKTSIEMNNLFIIKPVKFKPFEEVNRIVKERWVEACVYPAYTHNEIENVVSIKPKKICTVISFEVKQFTHDKIDRQDHYLSKKKMFENILQGGRVEVLNTIKFRSIEHDLCKADLEEMYSLNDRSISSILESIRIGNVSIETAKKMVHSLYYRLGCNTTQLSHFCEHSIRSSFVYEYFPDTVIPDDIVSLENLLHFIISEEKV